MPRYIYADDIKNAIEGVTRTYLSTLSTTDTIDSVTAKWLYKRLKTLVDEMPTADVRENVHAHWIKNDGRYGWHCSGCGVDDIYAYDWSTENGQDELQDHFCPQCGAVMDEREEDD